MISDKEEVVHWLIERLSRIEDHEHFKTLFLAVAEQLLAPAVYQMLLHEIYRITHLND